MKWQPQVWGFVPGSGLHDKASCHNYIIFTTDDYLQMHKNITIIYKPENANTLQLQKFLKCQV